MNHLQHQYLAMSRRKEVTPEGLLSSDLSVTAVYMASVVSTLSQTISTSAQTQMNHLPRFMFSLYSCNMVSIEMSWTVQYVPETDDGLAKTVWQWNIVWGRVRREKGRTSWFVMSVEEVRWMPMYSIKATVETNLLSFIMHWTCQDWYCWYTFPIYL